MSKDSKRVRNQCGNKMCGTPRKDMNQSKQLFFVGNDLQKLNKGKSVQVDLEGMYVKN